MFLYIMVVVGGLSLECMFTVYGFLGYGGLSLMAHRSSKLAYLNQRVAEF